MSQKIYLDDCACAKELVALLQAAGHQVLTPRDASIAGREDEIHFRYAVEHDLVLLTKNPDDFAELHATNTSHSGLLLIYQDNDANRDMSNAEIVRALANLEKSGIALKGACHVLNAWRY